MAIDWLTKELDGHKVSRQEVADALDVSRQYLWKMEKGKAKISLKQFRTLVKLLKLSQEKVKEIIK